MTIFYSINHGDLVDYSWTDTWFS